jgi:hypothetical protein
LSSRAVTASRVIGAEEQADEPSSHAGAESPAARAARSAGSESSAGRCRLAAPIGRSPSRLSPRGRTHRPSPSRRFRGWPRRSSERRPIRRGQRRPRTRSRSAGGMRRVHPDTLRPPTGISLWKTKESAKKSESGKDRHMPRRASPGAKRPGVLTQTCEQLSVTSSRDRRRWIGARVENGWKPSTGRGSRSKEKPRFAGLFHSGGRI